MFVTGRLILGPGRRTLRRLTVTVTLALPRMLAAIVLAGAPALAAVAAPSAAPALHVVDVWSRATAPGATVGVVYFTVVIRVPTTYSRESNRRVQSGRRCIRRPPSTA